MDKKCTNDTRFYLDENVDENLKDLDENFAWLITKDGRSERFKANLTLPPLPTHPYTHRVNVIELNCKVI